MINLSSQRALDQSIPSAFHPIGQGYPQDWQALRIHLNQHGFDLAVSEAPRQISSGFGNLNYLIMMNGQEWVLRRPPPGNIPPGANDMLREFAILRINPAAWQAGSREHLRRYSRHVHALILERAITGVPAFAN